MEIDSYGTGSNHWSTSAGNRTKSSESSRLSRAELVPTPPYFAPYTHGPSSVQQRRITGIDPSCFLLKPLHQNNCTLPPISPGRQEEREYIKCAEHLFMESATVASSSSDHGAMSSSCSVAEPTAYKHSPQSVNNPNDLDDSRALAAESGLPTPESRSSAPSPPLNAQSFSTNGIRCHYSGENNCGTNSPHRKVISQIFGRNKRQTKAIPEEIWPVYCRKHYQRHRYRNLPGFTLTQCELVRLALKNLDAWGLVKDYDIALRKCEADKCKDMLGNGDVYADSPRAPPRFDLHNFAGNGHVGKDSTYLLSVIESIENAVKEKELKSFPGIEILPNMISEDSSATKSKSKSAVRKKTKPATIKTQANKIPGASIMTMEPSPEHLPSSSDSSPVRSSRFQGRSFKTRASQRPFKRDLPARARPVQQDLNFNPH